VHGVQRILRGFDPRVVVGGVVILAVILAGVGGYVIADSKGVNVQAAQTAAMRAGEKRGTAQGAREGYARGFKATRHHAYLAAYRQAYGSAYRGEFERAGLPAPEQVTVHGP
jgi:hypothetical protein